MDDSPEDGGKARGEGAESQSLAQSFLIFCRGVIMGAADIVPGVSGGTMALITGIYERLVFGIRNISGKFLLFFIKGDFRKAKEDFAKIDFALFIPLLTGIALAFLALAPVIKWLLEAHPGPTFAFFLGLISASAFVVYRRAGRPNAAAIALGLAGFAASFLFIGLDPLQANHSLPVIFLSGFVAICAMILPGISGAFLLLFLGQYEYMLDVLHNRKLQVIFVFCLAALLGLLLFSRLLGYLLKHYRTPMLFFLIGLMLGSLRLPLQQMSAGDPPAAVWLLAVIAVGGFALVCILELGFGKKKKA